MKALPEVRARGAPADALHAVARVRQEWQGQWFGIAGLLDWRSLEVEALIALGQIDLAAQHLGELEQLQGDGAAPLACASTARLRALLSMARGDRAAASQAFAAAWQHASGLRVPLVLARLEMDEARFLRQGGQRAEAERSRACARPPPASLPSGRVPTRSFVTRNSPIAKPGRGPAKRARTSGSPPLSPPSRAPSQGASPTRKPRTSCI